MLVIIHGWSDSSRSFRRLGNRLVEDGVTDSVAHVRLGDYVSMDDEVTFDDLAAALESAWQRQQLPTAPRSVDVVVHSTGALVIRHWMTRHQAPDTTPVHRLLMLAPANFGSPLAHKGRSFLGRVVKGFKGDKLFQTGTRILKGLELASPFSWDLAQRDLFSDQVWYGPGGVLCTVLVGNSGYTGISAAANENGTDGTVRVSTANLNAAKLEVDFSGGAATPTWDWQLAQGRTAFARLNRENHSTIALKDGGPDDTRTLDLIRSALQVTDTTFPAHCDRLDDLARAELEVGTAKRFTHGYQNTVIRLVDDLGADVEDYFFEVYFETPAGNRPDNAWTHKVQDAFETVHRYCDNGAFRSILFDVHHLEGTVRSAKRPLHVRVTAMPVFTKNGNVGYLTLAYRDVDSIALEPHETGRFFQPDRTLLVTLRVKRHQSDGLFVFKSLG